MYKNLKEDMEKHSILRQPLMFFQKTIKGFVMIEKLIIIRICIFINQHLPVVEEELK
jgi:hypothetical protein